jgi:hypothetical protein
LHLPTRVPVPFVGAVEAAIEVASKSGQERRGFHRSYKIKSIAAKAAAQGSASK